MRFEKYHDREREWTQRSKLKNTYISVLANIPAETEKQKLLLSSSWYHQENTEKQISA